MSIIVPSHSRAASGSGSAFSPMWAEASAMVAAVASACVGRGAIVRPAPTPSPPPAPAPPPPPPPARDELLRLQRVEVLAHGAGELADPPRREVPEQDGLAVG